MKKLILSLLPILLLTGCNAYKAVYDGYSNAYHSVWADKTTTKTDTSGNNWISSDNTDVLEPDGYGLGVHKNRYGQPVDIKPDFGHVPGERLEIKTDAYGPGIHSDQYGRPVREQPWP